MVLRAQTETDSIPVFRYEFEAGQTQPFLVGSEYAGWHLGGLVKGRKPRLYHRTSADFYVWQYYPGTYFPSDSLGLYQDSGHVFRVSLAYGLERRSWLSERVSISLGAELGAEHKWENVVTNRWPEGNIRDLPVREVSVDQSWAALLNPYFGATIWFDEDLGLYGEWWIRTRLGLDQDMGTTPLNYDQSMEVRFGVKYRFGAVGR